MYIGTNYKSGTPVEVADLSQHLYINGATGTGKSVCLENMMAQLARDGEGFCFVDPHGDSIDKVLSLIPEERKDDIILIDLADNSYSPGLNFMTDVEPQKRFLAANNLVDAFKHFFYEGWGQRMDTVFRRTVQSLMDANHTLLALPILYDDAAFQKMISARTQDSYVHHVFWKRNFPKWLRKFGPELTSPIENKIDALLSIPSIRAMLGQQKNTVVLKDIMDGRKILLVSLAKGQIGELPASVMGSVIVSSIAQTAFGRSSQAPGERVPFHLIADEFQNYVTLSFASILSEARKYRLLLVLAHQGLAQIDEKIASSIFANCGSYLSFRIGAEDAPIMARNYGWPNGQRFLDLENHHAWLRTLEDGNPTTPVHVEMSPPSAPAHANAERLRNHARRKSPRRIDVERQMTRFLEEWEERTEKARKAARKAKRKADDDSW